LVEFALAAETASCLAIEDSNTGAKSAEAAGCTVLVVPNQVPVLDGPRRVFVDGSREHGAAELGAVLREAAPPAHRALLRLPDSCSPGSVDDPERTVIREPSASSLYTAIPFHQDASVLIIGERTNANGSKAFREAMLG
jgi:hypothetical protein